MKIPAIGLIMATLLLVAIQCTAAELVLGEFSSGNLAGWSDKIFKGKTTYTLIRENDKSVLKAHSENGASGLLKKVKLDPKEYPVLRWSWKVEHALKGEDVTR
jgi:hypothetical protein